MKTIDETNYEAFYLDFLEGNLSKEDTALLLAFLEEHPEFKLEEEEFISLDQNAVVLEDSYKQSLKQVVFDEDSICLSNIQPFLIAHTEGILSPEKERELDRFIALNPSFSHEQKLFDATRLVPNIAEVYADKSSLKQVKRVALWPFISLAAAASIALLITFGNLTSTTDPSEHSVANNTNNDTIKKQSEKKDDSTNKQDHEQKTNSAPIIEKSSSTLVATVDRQEIYPTVVKHEKISRATEVVFTKLKRRSNNHFFDVMDDDLEPEIASKNNPTPRINKPVQSGYTLLGFQDMKNPIEPVTTQLGTVIKKEVDFRSAKATSKHSGGFYLKIGKLVISRRTV